MKKWVFLLLLASLAGPARAAKNLSVEELDQFLAANHGKPDGRVAEMLSEVVLTERVTPSRFAQWEKAYTGSKTREELLLLADNAAFLKLPADDVLRDPVPDTDTQARMINMAVQYVKETFSRLPNFLATRATIHFEDAPAREQATMPGMTSGPTHWIPIEFGSSAASARRLRKSATFSAIVAYRDGAEVYDSSGKSAKEATLSTGLTTEGEFGPLLAFVLRDAIQSRLITWSHWERGEDDPIAVFHYSVPQLESHFSVGVPKGSKVETVYPGYRGEIAVDPATGSIMRLSLIGEIIATHFETETAILVDYAPVSIGDQTYICPVHGVAYSKSPVANVAPGSQNATVAPQTLLNDVSFTDYHLFRSEARMVSGADAALPPLAPPAAK